MSIVEEVHPVVMPILICSDRVKLAEVQATHPR